MSACTLCGNSQVTSRQRRRSLPRRPAPRGALSALQIRVNQSAPIDRHGRRGAGTHRFLGRLQLRELILQVPRHFFYKSESQARVGSGERRC